MQEDFDASRPVCFSLAGFLGDGGCLPGVC